MRLIDADKIGFTEFELFMISQEKEDKWKYAYQAISEKISRAPTVDAVPVVRCMECKYWDNSVPICEYCPMIDKACNSDFYCAYGERRTE